MNEKTYLDQHASIKEELMVLKTLVSKNEIKENARDLALHINVLAGKLNIHLIYEDRYLYPELIAHTDSKISKMANDYKKEMGGLEAVFAQFKDSYHTAAAITANEAAFKTDIRKVIDAIENRVKKEESGLYRECFK